MTAKPIAVTTVATPWAPLAELIDPIAKAGFDGVELALGDRNWDPAAEINPWQNNGAVIDYANALEETRAVKPLLQDAGLKVPVIGAYALSDDLDRVQIGMHVAQELGAQAIRVRVPWYFGDEPDEPFAVMLERTRERYAQIADMAAGIGIAALIEIHDNAIAPSASGAMRILEGLDPRQVGIILDPGNWPAEGHEALYMSLEMMGDYLHHVHVKDSSLDPDNSDPKLPPHGIRGKRVMVPLGEGMIDWPTIMGALDKAGYAGWYTLEDFTGYPRTTDWLAEGAAKLRALL